MPPGKRQPIPTIAIGSDIELLQNINDHQKRCTVWVFGKGGFSPTANRDEECGKVERGVSVEFDIAAFDSSYLISRSRRQMALNCRKYRNIGKRPI